MEFKLQVDSSESNSVFNNVIFVPADPPDPPSILGYEPGTQLRSGERVSLSCVSQGGNPPATLTWYRDDTELAASTEVHDSVARSVVTFQVDHTDNGRAYTCRSTNSEMTEAQSATVNLAVLCKLVCISATPSLFQLV